MEKLRAILLIVFFTFGIDLLNAEIEWLERNYNYGVIKESDGPRKGSVRFVNCGEEPVFISNARPSCGCTDVEYTKGMISPGDTAVVSFMYNPKGRPGSFEKNVRVYIGKENELHTVKLSGTVIGSATTLGFAYPHEAGPLRLETLKTIAGEMKKGSARHLFVNAYNQGPDTITPAWDCDYKALTVELTPRSMPPGDVGTFGFYLVTSEEDRMGPVEYKVGITSDGKDAQGERCEVTVNAVIVPDTRSMSAEEVENGPRAYLLPEFIDFGEIDETGIQEFSFEILNDGKSRLDIKRIYSGREGVDITKRPKDIRPGKKGKVKGKVDLRNMPAGAFRIPVEVITDDALHPIRIANLVGEIK